jgi:hypothetical protein
VSALTRDSHLQELQGVAAPDDDILERHAVVTDEFDMGRK